MTRKQWNRKYAAALKKKANFPTDIGLDMAAEANGYFEDEYSPEEAVDEELSYMEWE